MRNFVGQNEFTWFVGVVEDRNDPIQLGRVRVRCHGWHTEDKHQIPTGTLPWAIPLQSINSAATSGVGQSPTGLVEGSWVVGFFLDGQRAQEPVIMGSLASLISEYGDPEKGFYDPNKRDEPDDDKSIYPRFIKESDVNRLARNSNTVHNTSKDTRAVTNVSVPNSGLYPSQIIGSLISEDRDDETAPEIILARYTVDASSTVDSINHNKESETWNEPISSDKTFRGMREVPDGTYDRNRYHTVYPKNHVFESESGHIKEYDDTPYAERIHESHRTGTHYEIDADGNKVTHVVGNDYEVVMGTSFVNVKGDVNLTIDSNVKTYIKGDWDIQVDGSVYEHIRGHKFQKIDQTLTQTVDKEVTEIYNDTLTSTVEKEVLENYNNTLTQNVELKVTETYNGNQETNVTDKNAAGVLDINANTLVDIDAARIDLNKER